MKNQEIAALLYEIADILELKGVEWKPRAYRKAAQGIESLSEDIADIYKKGGVNALNEISGVGEAIARHVEEYLHSGRVKRWEEIKKSIPRGLADLMEVMGLGAKRAMILYKKLKIKSVADLERALKQHKIAKLSGFGAKSEENIAKGLEIFKRGKERMLLGDTLPLAEEIVERLKKFKEVHKIAYAGSLRRMKETIGDIDILVTTSKPKAVMDFFTSMQKVERVLAKGITKSTVLLRQGIQADLRVLADNEYGAALQYFTGNKEHNIKLREVAIKKGFKLSEYGLFKGSRKVAGRTEEEIYKKLGIRMMPPELREDTGEIEAAKAGKLPKLVELKDIRGDLHVHSNYSDGSDEIKKLAEVAAKLGYEYLALTDHSKTRAIARGLDEKRLQQQWKEIDALNKKLRGIRILKGTEVDILADGSLDYSDKILQKFDIVVASIHSGFKTAQRQMTERVIKALENKYVTIFGHPTGRLLNRRPAYEIDIEAVFDVAAEKKKVLEVDAFPDRLDLKYTHIKSAVEKGIKISIDTDAHSINHFAFMKYGVAQARRGWAEKRDVINTLSLKELLGYLEKGQAKGL